MQRLTQAIGKMFVVLVLLFGSPPPISLRQLRRRPAIVLVATAERRDIDPLALGSGGAGRPRPIWWGQAHLAAEGEPPTFQRVQAA